MKGYTVAQRSLLSNKALLTLSATCCGLCHQLWQNYGPLWALLVNHDAVLVALLIAAQREEPPKLEGTTRCPIYAGMRKETILDDGKALGFAAALSVLMAEEKLLDLARDDRSLLARLATHALGKAPNRAMEVLEADGLPRSVVERSRTAQRHIERSRSASLKAALDPLGSLSGAAFARTSHIAANAGNAETLSSLGSSIGCIVALADACEDLSQDRRTGSYNPLVARWNVAKAGPLPVEIMKEVSGQIVRDMGSMRRSLQRLRLAWMVDIVSNIVSRGFPGRVRVALRHLWQDNEWHGTIPDVGSGLLRRSSTYQEASAPLLPSLSHPASKSLATAFWLLSTLPENAARDASDLGFESQGEYYLACALPLLVDVPERGQRPRFCNDPRRSS